MLQGRAQAAGARPRQTGPVCGGADCDGADWGQALSSRYERIRVAGQGASGTAWLVRRRSDGLQFVAKEVSLELLDGPERDAARNEVRVLRELAHPNVVRYADHHEDDVRLVIVTEHCEGGDLEKFLEQAQAAGPPSESTALDIFGQVCLALEHVHSRNVLHRDLKAANVFMTAAGTVKVGDFGISKSLQHTGQHAITLCGTPFYFSPELCNGEPYNQKSDMWALGVLLYQLLAGRKPFEAPNILALVNCILNEQPPPLPRRCSDSARELVRLLLDKTPANRPAAGAVLALPSMGPFRRRRRTATARGALSEQDANRDKGARSGKAPDAAPPASAAEQQWRENRRAAAANKRRCELGAAAEDPLPADRSEVLPECGSWDSRSPSASAANRGASALCASGGSLPCSATAVLSDGATPRTPPQPGRGAAPADAHLGAATAPAPHPRRMERYAPACLSASILEAEAAAFAPADRLARTGDARRAAAALPRGAPASPEAPSSAAGAVPHCLFQAEPPAGSRAPSDPAPPSSTAGSAACFATSAEWAEVRSPPPPPETEATRWLLAAGITGADGGAAAFASSLCADGVHTLSDLRELVQHEDEFCRLIPGWGYRRRIRIALALHSPGLESAAAVPSGDAAQPAPAATAFATPQPAEGPTAGRDSAPPRSGCCCLM